MSCTENLYDFQLTVTFVPFTVKTNDSAANYNNIQQPHLTYKYLMLHNFQEGPRFF